jgi:hypothetical protein
MRKEMTHHLAIREIHDLREATRGASNLLSVAVCVIQVLTFQAESFGGGLGARKTHILRFGKNSVINNVFTKFENMIFPGPGTPTD